MKGKDKQLVMFYDGSSSSSSCQSVVSSAAVYSLRLSRCHIPLHSVLINCHIDQLYRVSLGVKFISCVNLINLLLSVSAYVIKMLFHISLTLLIAASKNQQLVITPCHDCVPAQLIYKPYCFMSRFTLYLRHIMDAKSACFFKRFSLGCVNRSFFLLIGKSQYYRILCALEQLD